MVRRSNDSKLFGTLYQLSKQLKEENNLHQDSINYQRLLTSARTIFEVKIIAARMLPKINRFFSKVASDALVDTHIELIEEIELEIRVQAILALPIFCQNIPKHPNNLFRGVVDILVQLLPAYEELEERDAVHRAIMSLLRLATKASLTALFKYTGSRNEPSTDETKRLSVIAFMRDQVFPLKAEVLKPREAIERHMTNLINKSLYDASVAELSIFTDFLMSFSIFGEKAPPDGREELIGILEAAADLDAQCNVSDVAYIERFIICLCAALPSFQRGASSSKFLNHLNKHIIPVFDKLPKKHKLCLVKAVAEISPYTTLQDSSQTLPFVVQLIKKHMVRGRNKEKMDFYFVEGLLYTFHHLAHKAPNVANYLCGYKITTGQPCDRLGDDFSEDHKQFSERLSWGEGHARATLVDFASVGYKGANDIVKTDEDGIITWLRSFNNILTMIEPLHSKTASFIGDNSVKLSWTQAVNPCDAETDLFQLLMDQERRAMRLQKKQKKRKRSEETIIFSRPPWLPWRLIEPNE